MSVHILLVEAEPAIQQLIGLNLTRAGHRVSCVPDAEAALAMTEDTLPDMVLLEWDLPGQSGIALIRRLRAHPRACDLPIIMVSARDGEHDKILALESGADDYITKPFSPREMIARIHALLRRRACDLPIIMVSARDGEHDKILALESGADDYITKPFSPREMIARIHALLRRRAPHAAADTVQMAGLRLDPSTHRVTAGTRQLALGRIEFRLLNFLMHHPERVHTRSQLLDKVWGSHVFLDERTVDAHVGRLRSALQPSGHQEHIETVRGSGYRFVAWDVRGRVDAAPGWQSAA